MTPEQPGLGPDERQIWCVDMFRVYAGKLRAVAEVEALRGWPAESRARKSECVGG